MSLLLGIDVGTTNCKAGLFTEDGQVVKVASRSTQARHTVEGYAYYDPAEMWKTISEVIYEVATAANQPITGIGIAGMAETGAFFDRKTYQAKSVFLPWIDTSATPQAQRLAAMEGPVERFTRFGIYPSFKCSLAKILWLRERDPQAEKDAVWLCVPDFVAYRLTGKVGTDYSLATRTYAFHIERKEWDAEWLGRFGLTPEQFAPARSSRYAVGSLQKNVGEELGLPAGIPVCVAGHDHVCAGFAMGAVRPGAVFDSMGTAESMFGALAVRPLDERDYASGLSYGCHVVEGMNYWLGGLSYSGGSVEWLRGILAEPQISYADLIRLLDRAAAGPSGILYYPYLAGSESPHPDPLVRGSFIGLSATHTRGDLAKAVLEGCAFEMESIRRAAEEITGMTIERIAAAGGSTRNSHWMQIKADISGCQYDIAPVSEATLLGAALLAGVAAGIYSDEAAAAASVNWAGAQTFSPDPALHRAYRKIFENGYLVIQDALAAYFHQTSTKEATLHESKPL